VGLKVWHMFIPVFLDVVVQLLVQSKF